MNSMHEPTAPPPTQETPPPQHPPDPAGTHRAAPPLRRSSSDRMVGGVCAGIGTRYGIDPSVLRVLFVVGIFAAGTGLLAYLTLALLVPRDTEPTAGMFTSSLWRIVLGALFAVGTVFAFVGMLADLRGLGVLIAAALTGLAVWWFLTHQRRGDSPPGGASPAPRSSVPPATRPATQRSTDQAGFAHGGTGGGYGSHPHPAPRPQRERSHLGLITLLSVVVAAGTMSALAAAGLVSIHPVSYLAVLLAVMAAGLVVGAFAGRARWLIVPALGTALVMGAVAAIPSDWQDHVASGIGERQWEPTSTQDQLSLGVGEATLDLRTWAEEPTRSLPEAGDELSAGMGIGQLNVIVPADWRVSVDASVALGEVNLDGLKVSRGEPDSEGVQASFTDVIGPKGDVEAELALDLDVGIGEISIRQAGASARKTDRTGAVSPDSTPGGRADQAGAKRFRNGSGTDFARANSQPDESNNPGAKSVNSHDPNSQSNKEQR